MLFEQLLTIHQTGSFFLRIEKLQILEQILCINLEIRAQMTSNSIEKYSYAYLLFEDNLISLTCLRTPQAYSNNYS